MAPSGVFVPVQELALVHLIFMKLPDIIDWYRILGDLKIWPDLTVHLKITRPSLHKLPSHILRLECKLTIFTVARVKYTCELNAGIFIAFSFIL